MADQVTNYQCPNCNGPLKYDPKIKKLKCDSCGSSFTTTQIDNYYYQANRDALDADQAKAQQEVAETLQWSEEEAKTMRAYNCPSCGAQLIADENTAATSCPYCGNPTVVPAQFEGSLKPDYIIPFKLVKEEAVECLKQFYHGKPLLPKEFTEENHIEEIKGVYVPFWLYDGTADAHLRAMAERSFSHETRDEIITHTDHFRVERDGNIRFEKIPADASSKMPDDFMDSIEPFDYNELQPFQMSYLPGYLADKYDVTSEEDADRADVRIKNSSIQMLENSIHGYQSYFVEWQNVSINPGQVHYAFLPVWILSTQYKDKNYLFAVNGQTGKMVGDDLPTDYKKMALYFVIITAVLMAVFYLILFAAFQ